MWVNKNKLEKLNKEYNDLKKRVIILEHEIRKNKEEEGMFEKMFYNCVNLENEPIPEIPAPSVLPREEPVVSKVDIFDSLLTISSLTKALAEEVMLLNGDAKEGGNR